MISDLAAILPDQLSAPCKAMRVCQKDCALKQASSLRDPEVFEAIIDAFGKTYIHADRGAVISLWSMYYLGALIIPSISAYVCLNRILPVGLDEIMIDPDESGTVSFHFSPAENEQVGPAEGLDTLVRDHIAPFAALCASRCGLSPRVFWNNAAVMMEFVLTELEKDIRWRQFALDRRAGLFSTHGVPYPYRYRSDGQRERRVCCQRYRLPGCAECPNICPRTKPADGPPAH